MKAWSPDLQTTTTRDYHASFQDQYGLLALNTFDDGIVAGITYR